MITVQEEGTIRHEDAFSPKPLRPPAHIHRKLTKKGSTEYNDYMAEGGDSDTSCDEDSEEQEALEWDGFDPEVVVLSGEDDDSQDEIQEK